MSGVHILSSPRSIRRFRVVAAAGLFLCLLVGCDRAEPPTQEVAASPTPAVKTWTDIPATRPEDRVTVHYHRPDGQYDGAEVWTWDAYQKKTPSPNTLNALGRDDFGTVYQLNRADYGDSDRIGLIPRLGHDWSRKDGTDKFWTASLGNEVWLISGKNVVLTSRPDLSPHVETAWLDGPNSVVLGLTEQAKQPLKITLLDQQDATHEIASATPDGSPGNAVVAVRLNVVPAEPLDVVNGRYRVQVEGFGRAVPVVPRKVLDDPNLFFDGDARLGAAYSPQGTTFRLFAPTANAVSVVLYDEAAAGKGRTAQALKPEAKGLWSGTVDGNLAGKFYVYVLDGPGLDPSREVLDPYATNAVASSVRGRITPSAGTPRPGPHVASPTDAVIYEMHVRDFTIAANSGVRGRGLYAGFAEGGTHLPDDAEVSTALDHLTELGVTHVELLPVQDYEDNESAPKYNWGYIPSAYFSPEGAYATNPDDDSRVREFKALVDALHARGIGVIMDVVYNHTASTSIFDSLVPGYYYRHQPDGSLADGSACGNDFRTEAPMARKLIVDSLAYWTREYGIDGYRFDLMALIDQETVRQVERTLKEINPSVVLYGEPWMATTSLLPDKSDKAAMRRLPVGAFNDDFRNSLKGSPDGKDPGFIQSGANREAFKSALLVSNWFAEPTQSVNYMTCHDNLVLWDKLKISSPQTGDDALIETMKLGYLALFTAQGVPFLHGGEEFARTKGGNNNSYNAPDAVNEVDWTLKRKHADLFNYTRDVIALRKAHPVFRLRTREEITNRMKFADTSNRKTLVYTLDAADVPDESWKRVCVALNGDTVNAEITLPEGQWTVAMDEHGAATERSVSGTVNVRQKSGLVLYQK